MKIILAVIALFGMALPAFAQGWIAFEATARRKLELRAAPGPYAPIATLPSRTKVSVGPCFFEGAWCEVTSGEISGFADATLLRVGAQTVQEKYAEYWQDLQSKSTAQKTGFTSSMIWTEGDSFMQGRYDVSLSKLIAEASFRQVDNTALDETSMEDISARMLAAENNARRARITVIWDGSVSGINAVENYVAQLQTGIDALGHDHFVVIPPP